MDIRNVDKNFASIGSFEGLVPYDIEQPPFRLYGLCREPGERDYKRLPHAFAEKINSPMIRALYTNTAGIRLRFRTDSQRIGLSCILPGLQLPPHFSRAGMSCFDLYADGSYCNTFFPGLEKPDEDLGGGGYRAEYSFADKKEREILLNFPLYNNVGKVYIALEEGASVLPAQDYAHRLPIVFYGSSITQGGCASHAGNSYPAILSRRLDTDYINLGFSGGCRAETELAEYIGSLPMRAFVYDYDHNASDAAFLQKTHEPFFQVFRKYQPETPVLMISMADKCVRDTRQRKAVIHRTWENARAAGDTNVWFLDGEEIYREVGLDYCTVDRCHPNDLGFWCMANAVEKSLRAILQ